MPCHDLGQTYIGSVVDGQELIILSVSTNASVSVEMTDQGLGLIAYVHRYIYLPLGEKPLFKSGVSERLFFLWNTFLSILTLGFIILRRFFNKASTEKLSHLSVVVHGSRLEFIMALKRADEHFVGH